MLRGIVSFSLRFRGIVIALACLTFGYGIYCAVSASLGIFPEFAPPQVVIQTEAPGLAAEQVEALVTQPIENRLLGMNDAASIRSQSIQGLSAVTTVFHQNSDIFRDRQMVSERLSAIAGEMPAGVGAPTLAPLTSATSTFLTLGLSSHRMAATDLWSFAYWTIRPRLLAVPGVAKIAIYGGGVRELQVQVKPHRLLAYGLGIEQVLAATRRATGVEGAGFFENDNQRIVIRTQGQALTPAQLGEAVVATRQGISVRLRDLARVRWAARPLTGDAAIFGKPGVILVLSSQYGANTLEVTRRTQAALRDLAPVLTAHGVKLFPKLFRATDFLHIAVRNVETSLLVGAALVAIVLILLLYDLRAAVISLSAIPLSLLIAVIALRQTGATLNTITLGGLAIAIGEVVDDAIIDVENIFRRLRETPAADARRPLLGVILDASLEVRGAVVYATFVVALVFFPVMAMGGVQGKLFAPLATAYVLAIMASLAIALTLTPALCAALGPRAGTGARTRFVAWLTRVHRRLLEAALDHSRALTMATTALCLAAAATLPLLGGSFLPELQESSFIVHMVGVPGTSIAESMRMGGRVTRALLSDPDVSSVAQRNGRAVLGDDTSGPQENEFDVALAPHHGEDLDEAQERVRQILGGFPGYAFSLNSYLTERIEETLSGQSADVVVEIFGHDLNALDNVADQTARLLRTIRGGVDVQVAAPGGMPELVVRLKPHRLIQFGFSPLDVLSAIRTGYQGEVAAQTYDGNRIYDVTVILDPNQRLDPEALGDLLLRSPEGEVVALRELTSISLEAGHYAILHDGGRREQIVTCNVAGRALDSFVAQARRKLASLRLPAGTYFEFGGAAQARSDALRQMVVSSTLAAALILVLLYLAFGNLANLALVLINVPFALVGGVLAAWLGGGYLSLGSIVGFVTLFGITMRNSIMMVSHFQHLVSVDGQPWNRATVLRAASERLLPIVITATVTALGVLPLALGSETPGREIEGPMAIIILGGLLTSTVLNLIILPGVALRHGRFAPPA
ncbi:MAG TPA: efflux RND transporter permease subunit [Candidatus Binataceae bacterium]|nr:efflux RND transporter permease subunit [Candidatus Binataceae bacterium]